MRVTYKVLIPLDGHGTILNPAYKWAERQMTEFCDTIVKAGDLYYMMRGGCVFHSVDVERITEIGFDGGKAIIKYYPDAPYPFSCRFINKFGNEFGMGTKEFEHIIRDIHTYSRKAV